MVVSLRLRAAAISQRDGKSLTALGTDIDRNLVGCTTDAARTNFDVRSDVVESGMEHGDRLLLQLALDQIERTVNDVFSDRLLTMKHDSIHELGDDQIAELRVRMISRFSAL